MKTKVYVFLLFMCIALTLPGIKVSAAATEDPFYLNETSLKLQVGNTYNLYLMNTNQSDNFYGGYYYPCIWSSSDESVATVQEGYVTIVGTGKATITATYNAKKYTCKIAAYASSYRLTKTEINTKTFTQEYVRMTHTDNVDSYTYRIFRLENNTETECYNAFDINTDYETGKIFLKASQSGKYRIDFYACVYDSDSYESQTYKASLNVNVQVHGLIERSIGCALNTSRTLTFGDLSQITFEVEDSTIAAVSPQGTITPLAIGDTYITMRGYNDQNELEEFECEIYVSDPKVTLEKPYVTLGNYVSLDIEGNSWVDDIIYKSSNEAVIAAQSCDFQAVKEGKAKVAVTVDGRKFVFDVEVINPRLKADSFLLPQKGTAQTTLLGLNNTLKQEPVTYSVGNANVASVSSDGKITAKACGNTILTVKLADFTFQACISVGNSKSIQAIKNATAAIGAVYSQERRMEKGYYDCSSLIWRSYAPTGVTFGDSYYAPTAANIAKYLYDNKKAISYTFMDPRKLQPGDLIFYGGEDNGRFKNIYHVSMFTGITPYEYYSNATGSIYPCTGRIIHASKGSVVQSDLSESYGNIVMIARPTK